MERNKVNKIKLLNVATSVDVGGVSTLLLAYYKRFSMKDITIDFVVIDKGVKQLYASDFEKMGCHIYYMPKNYFKRFIFYIKLLKRGDYDIVHSHIELMSAIYLLIAKCCGVKRLIAHAHLAFINYNGLINLLFRSILNIVSTDKWGCSMEAICSLFGKKNTSNAIVIKNAIDIEHFSYNEYTRLTKRNELNINNKFVVGYIGRFAKQKNPFFVLDIFKEILKINPNSILLTSGNGELLNEFKQKVSSYGLSDMVINLYQRKDINEIMAAIDVLLIPSLREGLGIVLIEAQTAALPTITSLGRVPEETNITPYIHYLDIKSLPETWAKEAIRVSQVKREKVNELIDRSGYNINIEACKLEQKLLKYERKK